MAKGQAARGAVYIHEDILKQAESLFLKLGLTLDNAVNIFLKQCILQQGLPFRYSNEVLEAMQEARQISADNNIEAYSSMEDLKKALEEDDL